MDTVVVRASPDPLTGLEDYDARKLLELGAEAYRAEAADRAAQLYEKLLEEFPEASVVPLAHYNAGLAYERLEDWPEAVDHFETIVHEHPGSEPHVDAHFNLARAYGKVENWEGVADTFWQVRQLDADLSPMDELEARVGTSVGLFMQDDFASAEKQLLSTLRFFEEHPQKEYLPAGYFVAQARFYLGEIEARAFERVELTPPTGTRGDGWAELMGDELEKKCDRLLRAQARFIRTIRVGHEGWATAAGFRIGSMYERLFDELLELPVPPDLSEEAAEIYREELRERVSVLVKKAIRVYESNREMAERVGAENAWVEKTTAALERMKKLYLATAES